MITSRLDKSKHFELVFSQIGGLEPDLWILEDLDIFWRVCCFSFIKCLSRNVICDVYVMFTEIQTLEGD